MSVLLDSHVLLWLVADDPSLGPGARDHILGADRVYSSSITMLELEIKRLTGRLVVPEDFASRVFEGSGVVELPFQARHAGRIRQFPELVRHDPFDRSLLAQAFAEGLDFCTADGRLLALGLSWVVDARR